ncbi:MAG: hypothetical protein H7842_12335, partial [Gammaproteobacteria bacterium SHHR-1]
MKTFLHIGCGPKRKDKTTQGFNTPQWQEVRFDIDESVNPDIVGTMLDMSAVASESVDAIYSSHNIEHLLNYGTRDSGLEAPEYTPLCIRTTS